MDWYRWDGPDLVLELSVQPRARQDDIAGIHDGRLRVRLTAPPVDDKANAALMRHFADEFRVTRAAVRIELGLAARAKRLRIVSPRAAPTWYLGLGGSWPAPGNRGGQDCGGGSE